MKIENLLSELIRVSQTNKTVTAEPVKEENLWKSIFHFVSLPYKDQFVLIYQKEVREAKPAASEYYLNGIAGDYKDGYEYSGFIHMKTGIWYEADLSVLRALDPAHDSTMISDIRSLENKFITAYKDRLVEKFLQANHTLESRINSDSVRCQLYKYIQQGVDIPNLTLRDEVEAWKNPPAPNLFDYLLSSESYVEGIVDSMLKRKTEELIYENSKITKIKSEYKKLLKNRSHPIWFKAEIIRSLPRDAKKVQATFQLDNCTVTDTLKAGDILDTTSLYLSGSDLPPKVIAVMKALTNGADERSLKYSAINQIQYRGKVIYNKADFMKQVNATPEGGH